MSLTLQETNRLSSMLAALEPEKGAMTNSAASFVGDQIDRFAKYKSDTHMSPKQMEWLESLYVKHVGSLDGLNLSNTMDEDQD